MDHVKIYRKRMIPDECILLKDDIILEQTDDIIITSWNTLKPRRDFHHGYSCYYPDGYIKVLDLNELAVAIEQALCEPRVITQALRKLDALLNLIYDDKFDTLSSYIDKWAEK